jgi:hypothetical protein
MPEFLTAGLLPSPTAGLSGLREYTNGYFRSLAEANTAAFISLPNLTDLIVTTMAFSIAASEVSSLSTRS